MKTNKFLFVLFLLSMGLVLVACQNNEARPAEQLENTGYVETDEGPIQLQYGAGDVQNQHNNSRIVPNEDILDPNTKGPIPDLMDGEESQYGVNGYRNSPRRPNEARQQKEATQSNQVQKPNRNEGEQASEGTVSQLERQVVELTNAEREKNGIQPLKMNAKLANVAKVKSQDMSDNNYFSHNSPQYGDPFEMMQQFNVDYSSAAENIAAGQTSAEQVVSQWMNSEGHRKNILNEKFTEIGVGHVEGGSHGAYFTQMFRTP